MTTAYYIQHKSTGVFGVAILATEYHIAILWETGNRTLHAIPDNSIIFHEAGFNIKQPSLRDSLPSAKRMIEADFALDNVKVLPK